MERHAAKEIPDDVAAPVFLAQDADRREAEQIAAAVRASARKK
jgi:hypothetical protein